MNMRRKMLGGLGVAALSTPLVMHAIDPKAMPLMPDTPTIVPPRASDQSAYFPNSIFTTHEGRKVRFYDDLVKNKIVIIDMLLITCRDGICPLMTANLRAVQQALGNRVGKDIFMYSMTINPEYDTDFMLKSYAEAFNVGKGWSFLTGPTADTEVIRRKLGFSSLDPAIDKDPAQHTGMLRIGNDKLNRWCMMPGLLSARQIAYAARDLS